MTTAYDPLGELLELRLGTWGRSYDCTESFKPTMIESYLVKREAEEAQAAAQPLIKTGFMDAVLGQIASRFMGWR